MSSKHSLDSLGDRLKHIERIETEQIFIPNLPIYVRLDGRSFSKFTKGLTKPYDEQFTKLMVETTKYLVKEFNATIGYTQSDEISLVINNTFNSSCIFSGKKQKLISTISSAASAFFNSHLRDYLPEKASLIPTFDCRIFNVPNVDEATNCILWREQDATKNSILSAGYNYFSHKDLYKLKTDQIKVKLLKEKNVNWDDYPSFFKYGTYVQREVFELEDNVFRSHVVSIDWFNSLKEFDHKGRVQIVMNNYPELEDQSNESDKS